MNNKAYFFRDVKNVDELKHHTAEAFNEEHRPQKFHVIAEVGMTPKEFDIFRTNFMVTFDFLKPYRVHADGLTTKGEYNVVKIVCQDKERGVPILVHCSGYSYARQVAFYYDDFDKVGRIAGGKTDESCD